MEVKGYKTRRIIGRDGSLIGRQSFPGNHRRLFLSIEWYLSPPIRYATEDKALVTGYTLQWQ